jgi:putative ABC transport system permease protein
MNNLGTFPWVALLLLSTSFLGLAILIPLQMSKYPSTRALGKLIGAFVLCMISFAFFEFSASSLNYQGFLWVPFIAMAYLLRMYVYTFFHESVRIERRSNALIVVSLSVVIFLLSDWVTVSSKSLLLHLLASIISLAYLVSTLNVARDQAHTRGFHWFQNPGSRLVWLRNFISLNAIFILLATITLGKIESYYFAFFMLGIVGYIYKQSISESAFLSPLPLGKKYKKSTLTPYHKAAILERLDLLITRDKFYLESEVSLSALAQSLKTTTHHLSQVLNESKGLSFQELISQYRVKEAKLILKDPANDQTKIEHIAVMVGYNSKSAFNTAFKKYTNLTPTDFRETKGVLTYREEQLPDRKSLVSYTFDRSSYHVSFFNLRLDMISNFLKVFIRSIFRNKIYSAINLLGLVIAFSGSLLIYLYLSNQLTYDQEIKDYEQIYRVAWDSGNPQTRTPHPMAQAMVTDFPSVVAATTLSPWYGAGLNKQSIRVKNVKTNILFEEPDFYFADSTFLDVFDLEVVTGDKDALRKPWNIVITEELARKYFGTENPIGQELTVNDMPVAVAAVLKGMPDKSHFHFSAILSYVTLKAINPQNPWLTWDDFGHFNYIKTTPQLEYKALESSIPKWVSGYLDWDESQLASLSENNEKFVLQPIKDIHLKSNLRWELEQNGNMTYIYILRATMFFLLLIGAINYINLTTAKSTERAKEIGIRKTIGAYSGNLVVQFYLEALLFCFVSLVLAFGLGSVLLEPFNHITGSTLSTTQLYSFDVLGKALIACGIITLLAGAYPATILSAFVPSQVLKGSFSSSDKGVRLRGILVVAQFAISAILIIASLIVLNQLNYMKTKELGFDKEAVISIRIFPSVEVGGIDINKVNTLKTEFMRLAGVQHVASMSNLPGSQFDQNKLSLTNKPEESIDISELYVDFEATQTLGLSIVSGRSFDPSFAADSAGLNFLINQTAATQLDATVGDKVIWDRESGMQGNVIGIVQDFHFQSLHDKIRPLMIVADPFFINHLIIKLDGRQFQQTLSQMETVYGSMESEFAFEYKFLDQELAAMYDSEVRILNVFSIFSGLALFLACLGLLGMVITILNQKVKEVGIRKILGASNGQIIQMVLAKFTRLIAIALVIGLPVGYILMQGWIAEFSYRAPFSLVPFLLVVISVIGMALLSISVVVMRIAKTDPVQALKYE